MAGKLEGAAGVLDAGFRVAARLGAWRLYALPRSAGADRSRVVAAVLEVNAFYIGRATRLRLQVGTGWWAWAVANVQIGAGRLEVELVGDPEVIGHGTQSVSSGGGGAARAQ